MDGWVGGHEKGCGGGTWREQPRNKQAAWGRLKYAAPQADEALLAGPQTSAAWAPNVQVWPGAAASCLQQCERTHGVAAGRGWWRDTGWGGEARHRG